MRASSGAGVGAVWAVAAGGRYVLAVEPHFFGCLVAAAVAASIVGVKLSRSGGRIASTGAAFARGGSGAPKSSAATPRPGGVLGLLSVVQCKMPLVVAFHPRVGVRSGMVACS